MSLEVSDLVSGYGKIEVVHGVTLHAEKSRVTGIIGPNGSGKSTVLKTIYGYLKPSGGKVTFDGKEITGKEPQELLRLGVGYLMQRRSVFPYLTTEQNLKLGGWIFGRDEEKKRKAIEAAYERFPKLRERRKLLAGSLSGGEQRMVELARALMTRPRLLIVDEFSTGLSPKLFKQLYKELVVMKQEEGITILAVDQNVAEVAQVADYMYVLKLGRVVEDGPAEQFRGRLLQVTTDWLKA